MKKPGWTKPRFKRNWSRRAGEYSTRKKGSRKVLEGLQELVDERIRRKKKPAETEVSNDDV